MSADDYRGRHLGAPRPDREVPAVPVSFLREPPVQRRRFGGLLAARPPEADPADGTFVAEEIARRCDGIVETLHHRTRGTGWGDGGIEHIVIAASGVYVIDAEDPADATVSVAGDGLTSLRDGDVLRVDGSDRTHLAEGLAEQVTAVTAALVSRSRTDVVPVGALLCFLRADLSECRGASVHGFPVLDLDDAIRVLRQPGPIGPRQRRLLREHLEQALPAAA